MDLHGCPCTITLLTGPLTVSRNLTVTGPGADQLVVSGNHASRVFEVASGVSFALSALTVADGDGSFGAFVGGGGIRSLGALDVRRVVFRDNSAGDRPLPTTGGAIESMGPTDVLRTTLLALALVALGVDTLAAARLLGPRRR